MADQVGFEINSEAATNLAEDVSYKLRQTISVSIEFLGFSICYELKMKLVFPI